MQVGLFDIAISTSNSAIADKPRGAFTSHSRSPNMVLFRMIGRPMVSISVL